MHAIYFGATLRFARVQSSIEELGFISQVNCRMADFSIVKIDWLGVAPLRSLMYNAICRLFCRFRLTAGNAYWVVATQMLYELCTIILIKKVAIWLTQ